MSQKIARWLREIKIEPPQDTGERPHVVQHLFKVSPPMEFTRQVVYRNGKLINEEEGRRRRRLPNRTRVMADRMRACREAGIRYDLENHKPRYFYSYRLHRTSFVVASASDLKTYMSAAHARMREKGQKELDYYLALERSDPTRQEGIEQARETIRLFSRDRDEFEVETYLFPATKFGEIKNYGELEGSQRGTLDHRVPLQDAGYTVIGMPRELTLVPIVLKAAPWTEVDSGSGFRIATTIKEEK